VRLNVSLVGRAIARSGLLPLSADELLQFVSANAHALAKLVVDCAESDSPECDDFAFVMIHAAFNCSEYGGRALGARRYLPYQLAVPPLTGPQTRVAAHMFATSQTDALNAAVLATRWVAGVPMRNLESVLEIRSGVLSAMFADAANILRGTADILYALTVRPVQPSDLPTNVDPDSLHDVAKLVWPVRRLAARLDAGLPEEVLWMTTLEDQSGTVVNRTQIMALRGAKLSSPDHLLDTGRFPQLLAALGPPSAAVTTFAQRIQQAVRSWRLSGRQRLLESQLRRLPADCRPHLQRLYRTTGRDFETALEQAFECIGVKIRARDDGSLPSFPDLVTASLPPGEVAIECKSKTVGDSVDFNDATDVIRKASVNGLGKAFKITVCQPYLSPDVPRKLAQCDELSVVNAEDLAEAIVRVKLEKLTLQSLADWLHRPGHALREMIPNPAPKVNV
jgi:hypothetical protein